MGLLSAVMDPVRLTFANGQDFLFGVLGPVNLVPDFRKRSIFFLGYDLMQNIKKSSIYTH